MNKEKEREDVSGSGDARSLRDAVIKFVAWGRSDLPPKYEGTDHPFDKLAAALADFEGTPGEWVEHPDRAWREWKSAAVPSREEEKT